MIEFDFKPCSLKTAKFLKSLEAAGKDISKMTPIEAMNGDILVFEQTNAGTKIHGMLAYPGISSNGKLYSIGELMHGDGVELPIWLNHGTMVGTDGIGEDLLPDSYRRRLEDGEEIIVGNGRTWFDSETLQLLHEGIITDSFYKNPNVLKKMSVSQGVLHPADLPSFCDEVSCYKIIQNSIYQEYSIVFKPGFSIATLSTESVGKDSSYIHALENHNHMSKTEDSSKSNEQASGNPENSGVPSTPKTMIDHEDGKTYSVPTEPLPEESTEADSSEDPEKKKSEEADDMKKDDEDPETKKKADEVRKGELIIKAAKEAQAKASEAKAAFEKLANVTIPEKSGEGYDGPNADKKTRDRAQMEYLKALEAKDAQQNQLLRLAEKAMENQKQMVIQKAKVGNNVNSMLQKSLEAANMTPKRWIDKLIKGDENTPWNKIWKISPEYTNNFVTSKFRDVNEFGNHVMKSYDSVMGKDYLKSFEATNASMAGGADPNNFQRTQSELVFVYPSGIIVTPIQQFCETAILAPGKKEHLFYDVDIPEFNATDEQNMDAGGGGYALQASDVTINASGGKTFAQGGLVRIGFTNLEEIPVDIIQKVNIGFAMRAEERKNYQVLNTAYNTDTAYDPLTDAIRPIGGGAKHTVDSEGNRHWIDGTAGTEISTANGDSGSTGVMKYVALLNGRKKIEDTGIDVENVMMYTTTQARNDLLNPATTDISSYVQRSLPEIITEGVIEKLSGVQLITTNSLATHPTATTVSRSVMFVPTVSFGFVTGRELQVDAERVARQQSVFATASMKTGAFTKIVNSTCRISSKNA